MENAINNNRLGHTKTNRINGLDMRMSPKSGLVIMIRVNSKYEC